MIKSIPSAYYECHLRNVFNQKEEPIEHFEKDIIRVKTFIEKNDLEKIGVNEIEELVFIITKEKISFQKFYKLTYKQVNITFLKELLYLVCQEHLDNKDVIMKICILISSIRYDDVPLIPYRSIMRTICNNFFDINDEYLYCILN